MLNRTLNNTIRFLLPDTSYDDDGPNSYVDLDLSVYFGCAFSIAGLSLTLFTFYILRRSKFPRKQQALLNLTIALLLAYVTFVSGIEGAINFTACLLVAVLLHYFISVSFIWMLIHGILIYLDVVEVFQYKIEYFLLKSMLSAWGLPAFFIGILVNVDYRWYSGKNKSLCWMDVDISNYIFRIPIGLILVINVGIYISIFWHLFFKKTTICKISNNSGLITKIKAATCMLFLMGLTWVFTIFTVSSTNHIFSYLFCIFNILQGFFICIFRYLAIYDQPEWKNFLKRSFGLRKRSVSSNAGFNRSCSTETSSSVTHSSCSGAETSSTSQVSSSDPHIDSDNEKYENGSNKNIYATGV